MALVFHLPIRSRGQETAKSCGLAQTRLGMDKCRRAQSWPGHRPGMGMSQTAGQVALLVERCASSCTCGHDEVAPAAEEPGHWCLCCSPSTAEQVTHLVEHFASSATYERDEVAPADEEPGHWNPCCTSALWDKWHYK
ncbi:hypothetical protein NDU88_000141 [Pleurodeles waltl]|uniref:Uncharacterized protein n=1 Tax=Pleurodeles waltl TaxID=8319 RepID=A0AAV7S8N8_PLEWA|nr:hypothetical protein NDU88_000141 [Pleurodeles waltl]